MKPIITEELSLNDFPSNLIKRCLKIRNTMYVFDRIEDDKVIYYNPMVTGDTVEFKSKKEMEIYINNT